MIPLLRPPPRFRFPCRPRNCPTRFQEIQLPFPGNVQTKDLFNVYRSTEKGKYGMRPINPEPLSEPAFKDTFSVNSVVSYTVRSLTGSSVRDESSASEELTVDAADLVPQMPLNLQAFPAPDRVILSWTELDELWITGFKVYRKTGDGDFILWAGRRPRHFLTQRLLHQKGITGHCSRTAKKAQLQR